MAVLVIAAGCKDRSTDVVQQTGPRPDAGRDRWQLGPTGSGDGDIGGEAGPACVPTKEICNLQDDDCDGVIDNVAPSDLASDPNNCGQCGLACSFPRAQATCVAGACAIGTCNAGYVDLDKKPDNGCECVQSNGGVEVCDGKDNDCDGLVDEDFDLKKDPANCGKCGVVCSFPHADATCTEGACTYACQVGHVDLDKKSIDGCEYACAPSNGGVEICDGKDNDCDGTVDVNASDVGKACGDNGCLNGLTTCIAGKLVCVGGGAPTTEICDGRDNDCNGKIDDADPNLGKFCYPGGVTGCEADGKCLGECKAGAWVCTSGALSCTGAVTPQMEICDGKDNDCDGKIDEDFDLQTDPRHCGDCATVCKSTNAIAGCSAGKCRVAGCQAGWVDANHDAADGCEYQCTPDGPEICDGKDNDCNGKVDEADPGLLYPVVNFCLQGGECGKGPGGSSHYSAAATFPVCKTANGASQPDWVCNYPDTVQVTAPNKVIGQETWCDGLDNDCDGSIDEHATPVLGTNCDDGAGLGECRRTGTIKCQADKAQPPACAYSAPTAPTPTDEICDGKDNDCDGLTDESWDNPTGLGLPACAGGDCRGVRDSMVHVTAAGAPGGGYYIYAYEASRPDGTAAAQGTAATRSCSRGGVLPWSTVNFTAAAAACQAAGMRLCQVRRDDNGNVQSDEWGFACSLGKTCTNGCYPYAANYDGAVCNGADKGLNAAATCGSLASCASSGDLDTGSNDEKIFDLSGNLAEWTNDLRSVLGDGRKVYTTRGGAFDSFQVGLRCDFTAAQVAQDFAFPDTGFRCCSSCAPGQAECAGACKNLASDNANCGSCGTVCTTPATCKNGVCK
jgi:hypothetical protein